MTDEEEQSIMDALTCHYMKRGKGANVPEDLVPDMYALAYKRGTKPSSIMRDAKRRADECGGAPFPPKDWRQV